MGLLILLSFLLEVGVLLYLEVKAWNTLYTPLVFLMLPYVVVLLITVCVSGHFGFVEFNYSSIIYWSAGLLLFAVPSYLLGFLMQKNGRPVSAPIRNEDYSNILLLLSVLVCLAFLYRFKQTLGSSSAMMGSDDFGEDFDGHGFWAHLSKFYTPLLVIGIYYVGKERKWLWIVIILLLFFSFLHQVKGWIIIPCIAGLSMRLYSGKTRLTMKFLLLLLLGAVAVFLISYLMSFVLGNGSEMGFYMVEFILRHFAHYLTSGVLGFSMDLSLGMPDAGPTQILFNQLSNIVNLLSGEKELTSAVNGVQLFSGINYTNVRTFFGTIAIYCSNPIRFVLVTLFLSLVSYLLKILTVRNNSIYANVIYFYQCSLLAMGWFEYYFFHLDAIEVPAMAAIIGLLVFLLSGRNSINTVQI